MTMEEKIDLILEKMIEFDSLSKKVDGLEEKTNKIDMLVEKTNKIDMLVEKTNKIDMLIEKVNMIEKKTDKIDMIDMILERLTALEKDHESMKRILILIEDDTSNKIPALFDGYSFHQQHIEEDERRLDVLENQVDEHSIRLSVLEEIN